MNIVLYDYDTSWPAHFSQIRTQILGALRDAALAVEHVGSTSIPGLCAKPVIDVLLVVSDSSDEAAYAHRLEECGFKLHHREPEWHEHRLFKFSSPAANIHVFSSGCSEIERMVCFRDFLRSDTHARQTYESKKRELAQREWTRVQEYADAKGEVVEGLLNEAIKPK